MYIDHEIVCKEIFCMLRLIKKDFIEYYRCPNNNIYRLFEHSKLHAEIRYLYHLAEVLFTPEYKFYKEASSDEVAADLVELASAKETSELHEVTK